MNLTMDSDKEYYMQDLLVPSILIVEDDTTEQLHWGRISSEHDNLDIVCESSPTKIMFAWLKLYANDHIPRVLIVDWHLSTNTIGMLSCKSDNGTKYDIDGAAFVIVNCMEAVGKHAGMFIAYTNDPEAARRESARWPSDQRDRLHIIDKSKISCEDLLEFIMEHDDYINQDPRDET